MRTKPMPDPPIPNSYWVRPGHFAAGEYPGAQYTAEAAARLKAFVKSVIDHFVDLTEIRDGLKPYAHIAEEEARKFGKRITWERYPIRDMSVPRKAEEMTNILDAIDSALDGGRTVYVHCWGGVGRTGTVVGCWLVRHGYTGEAALAQIAVWWKRMEKAYRVPSSPETPRQRRYVLEWTEDSPEGVSI